MRSFSRVVHLYALVSLLCFAEISNVRVAGTTSTQAILAYDAPDENSCSVEVSESATYTPLVHDSDEALFPGAGSDMRPGAITSGRSRLVVIGKHGMTASGPINPFLATDGNVYSRALQANALHYYRIRCGGDEATGSFTTANIPLGNTYTEPLPAAATNPGVYNWPSITNPSSREEYFVDPDSGALIRKVTLSSESNYPKNSNTWASGGMYQMCSHQLISSGDHTYTLCVVPAALYPTLYSIETDTGTAYALTRILVPYGTLGCTNGTAAPGTVAFSRSDARKMYFFASCSAVGTRVFQISWTGRLDSSNPVPAGTFAIASGLEITDLTPQGIAPLIAAFDPRYDATQQSYLRYILLDGSQNGQLLYHIVSQQDSLGWIGLFDPGNGQPVGMDGAGGITAANPTWRSPVSRWCSLHSIALSGDSNPWIGVTSNSPGEAASTYMGGAYAVVVANNAGKGNLIEIAPSNGSYEPQSSSQPSYLQDAAVGDLFWVNGIGPGGRIEPIEIVSKDPVNHTWTVLRGDNLGASAFINGSGLTPGSRTPVNITPGMKLYAGCRGTTFSSRALGGSAFWYWDYVADPHGTSITYPAVNGTTSNQVVENYAPGGHQVTRDAVNVTEWQMSGISGWFRWTYENGIPGYDLIASPRFSEANVAFAGVRGPGGNINYAQHPSFDQLMAPEQDKQWIVDALPLDNGGNYTAKGSLIDGQTDTYKITGATLHRKHNSTFASCGLHPLIDISSPITGDVVSDATPYTYCVANAPGECRSASVLGDVYVNCPGATKLACNTAQATATTTDICIGDSWAYGNAIVQAALPDRYADGHSGRVITRLFATHHGESRYKNVRPTTDGKWLLFSTYPALTSQSAEAYMAKLPPFPPEDSTRRDTFIPVEIAIPAVSDSNPPPDTTATVEFGYAENGDVENFQCSSRRESCVAQGNAIDEVHPFYFSSTEADAITGTPCTSGCKITIPAVPGRVVYYRITVRDGQGNILDGPRTAAYAVP